MQRQAILVDDSRVARMTLTKLVKPYDVEVVEFGSGEDAISYLQAGDKQPAIIFMDVSMSGLSGFETTEKIKQIPSLHSVPVVMCTGHDTPEEKQKAAQVGAMTVLAKPPSAEQIAQIMESLSRDIEEAHDDNDEGNDIDSIINALQTHWLPTLQHQQQHSIETILDDRLPNLVQVILAKQNQADKEEQESELQSKVLTIVKAELMPEIEQQIHDVEASSRANELNLDEAAEAAIDTQLQQVIPALITQIESELQQQATNSVATEAKQQVKLAIDGAVQVIDLQQQTSQLLTQQSEPWFAEQQARMTALTHEQIEQDLPGMIANYLQENAPEDETEQDDQQLINLEQTIEQLNNRVSILTMVSGVLAIAVVAALIF